MEISTSKLYQHLYGARLVRKLYGEEYGGRKNTLIRQTKDKRRVYVALSGTQRMSHLLYNVNVALNDKGVHSGFKSFADGCYMEIMDELSKSSEVDLNRIESMTFVSHSLGAGALIVLLYEELLRNSNGEFGFEKDLGRMDMDVVMLGAPKSGNADFSRHFNYLIGNYPNIKMYRYLIENDFITEFPPISQYAHVCDGIPMYEQKRRMNIFYNHSLNNYIMNIKRMIESARESHA